MGDQMDQLDQMMQTLPGVNMVRLATSPKDDMNQIQGFINNATSKGLVVEIEDHSSSGSEMNALTGSALQDEENWYAQLAAANKNNPNVWFGTANEPDANNKQDIVNQEVGIYNAIRDAGNNNMIMLSLQGGSLPDAMKANPEAYANMSNVAWDLHFYGWRDNYEGGAAVGQQLQNDVQAAQSITGAQGTIPVIVGEYGNSTNGSDIDPNGMDVVKAVDQSGLGTLAWAWDMRGSPNQADSIRGDNADGFTEYGAEIARHIAQGG